VTVELEHEGLKRKRKLAAPDTPQPNVSITAQTDSLLSSNTQTIRPKQEVIGMAEILEESSG